MTKISMGEFISVQRKAKGMTQQQVADELGVSNKTVSSWETGASCPDISLIPAIADLFGVTCDEILRAERVPPAEPEDVSARQREHALRYALTRRRSNAVLCGWISAGLSAVGLIVTLIVAFAASNSLIAFLVGLIFLIASLLVTLIACSRAMLMTQQESVEGAPLDEFRRELFSIRMRAIVLNLAVFGFVLPHLLMVLIYRSNGDLVHFTDVALSVPYAFLYGAVCCAAMLLLCFPLYLTAKGNCKAFDERARKLAFWNLRHGCLLGLSFLALSFGIITGCVVLTVTFSIHAAVTTIAAILVEGALLAGTIWLYIRARRQYIAKQQRTM